MVRILFWFYHIKYQPYVRPCFLPTTMHLEIIIPTHYFLKKNYEYFLQLHVNKQLINLSQLKSWNAMKKSMQKIQEPRYWFVYLLYSYTKTNIWCKMQKFTYSNLIRFEYTYFCILHQRYLTSFQQKNRSQTMKYFPKSQYSMALCLLGSGGL